jgi:hypothetical protein
MKKLLIITLLSIPLLVNAEVDAGLAISGVKDIGRTSMGVRGEYYPQLLCKGKLSLGCEFGLELVERFVYDLSDMMMDSARFLSDTSDYDYAVYFNKEYRDYMFIPLGFTLRYSLGDPEKIRSFNPLISLSAGGILNIYQSSYRQFQDWYENNDSGGPIGYLYSTYVDFGGESISTFDFYLKPKLTLTYNRFYISYERLFNTRYVTGAICLGYVFKL